MKNKKIQQDNIWKNERGSALILTMMILISGILIFTSIMSISLIQRSASSKTRSSAEAYQIADSCVEWTLKKYYDAEDGVAISSLGSINSSENNIFSFNSNNEIPNVNNFLVGGEAYDVDCEIYLIDENGDVIDDESELFQNVEEVRVIASAGFGEDVTKRAVQVRMKAPWLGGACEIEENIFVYSKDVAEKKQWKTQRTACDTPQCVENGAQEGDYLVAENEEIDFVDYPAREACQEVDGRLPDREELSCIYNNKSEYGIFENDYYWSSEESGNSSRAYRFYFVSNLASHVNKDVVNYVRCVKDVE